MAWLPVAVASLHTSHGYEHLGDSHHPGRGSEPSSSAGKAYSALWDCKVAPEVGGWFFFFFLSGKKKKKIHFPLLRPRACLIIRQLVIFLRKANVA